MESIASTGPQSGYPSQRLPRQRTVLVVERTFKAYGVLVYWGMIPNHARHPGTRWGLELGSDYQNSPTTYLPPADLLQTS